METEVISSIVVVAITGGIWTGICWMIANAAVRRNRGWARWFWSSFLVSPLWIGLLLLLVGRAKVEEEVA